IVLFSKGCPNPSFPLCVAAAAVAPAQATIALAHWQPHCQGVATPAAGAAAPTGGSPLRVPCSRPPLQAPCCKRLCPRATAALRASPIGSARGRLPPLSGWPWQHLVAAWPWVTGPA
ncbi:hypothetical protein BHE74_00056611, partial [Ensete ventricosum]